MPARPKRAPRARDRAVRPGLRQRGRGGAGADLVVLCVPVGAMGGVAAGDRAHLAPGATVSDVGSVKRDVIDAVGPAPARGACISCPPTRWRGPSIPGRARALPSCSTNRWCLIVPQEGSDRDAVARLEALWQGMGALTDEMDAEHHDLVLAVTSHAPHLIAYTMVGVADDLRRVTDSEVIKYSAAGVPRLHPHRRQRPDHVARRVPANKDATLEILGRFTEELFALQRAIRTGDGDHLHAYFTRTRAIRRGIIEAGQDTDAPDFGRVKKGLSSAPRRGGPGGRDGAPRCRVRSP